MILQIAYFLKRASGVRTMPGRARKLVITERQQTVLQMMVRSGTCPQAVAQRARMILLAFDGLANEDIARQVGCERHAVGPWRRRWAEAFRRLILVECCEKPSAPPNAITELLSDRPRSGSPGKFTAEQVTQILAVACEDPEASGRPVTHWTPRELADEVVKRKIVASISARQVGRFLKSGRVEAAPEPVLAQRRPGRPRRLSGAGPGRLRVLPGGSGVVQGRGPHGERR
jgi:putative transposase